MTGKQSRPFEEGAERGGGDRVRQYHCVSKLTTPLPRARYTHAANQRAQQQEKEERAAPREKKLPRLPTISSPPSASL